MKSSSTNSHPKGNRWLQCELLGSTPQKAATHTSPRQVIAQPKKRIHDHNHVCKSDTGRGLCPVLEEHEVLEPSGLLSSVPYLLPICFPFSLIWSPLHSPRGRGCSGLCIHSEVFGPKAVLLPKQNWSNRPSLPKGPLPSRA